MHVFRGMKTSQLIRRIIPISMVGALALSAAAQSLPPPPYAPPGPAPVRTRSYRHPARTAAWQSLGAITVRGRQNVAVFELGSRYYGQNQVARSDRRFDTLMLASERGAVQITEVILTTGNGRTQVMPMNITLYEGQQRTLDLPGNARFVDRVELRLARLRGSGRAQLALYGRTAVVAAPPPAPVVIPPPPAPAWDSRGWTLVSEQRLAPGESGKRFNIGRERGVFQRFVVVTLDADVEIAKVDVITKHEMWSPEVRDHFNAGAHSRIIDLPAATRVNAIDIYYRSPIGSPRIQIWAQ